MIRLHWAGESNIDIGAKIGYTEQQVSNIINSPEAKAILAELSANALDSMDEVAQELQLVAPIALKRKIDMLYCGDDRVADKAATDLLHMAGHAPTKRVQVTGQSVVEKEFEGLSPEEIRQKILNEVDGNGPDGRPLS